MEILDRKYLLEAKEKLQIEEQERKEKEKKLKEEKHKKAKKVILMSSICCGITLVLLFLVYGLINLSHLYIEDSCVESLDDLKELIAEQKRLFDEETKI